jgi:adenine deaminase
MNDGHLDCLLRRLVEAGLSPADAVRHASFTAARHYGLRNRGAVAPGCRAGLVVFDDAKSFDVNLVVQDGRIVVRDGEMQPTQPPPRMSEENTIHLPDRIAPELFRLKISEGRGTAEADVIGVVPDQIVTARERMTVPTDDEGCWRFDPQQDLALIACVQRHQPTGDLGLALVKGFGFATRGALASSVGHDAHNILVTGTNESDVAAAVEALRDMGGGFVCVANGVVAGRMPLPVAGLLSQEPAHEVVRQLNAVNQAARSLGCSLHSPFGTLSFLGLSVIPALKVTDLGLFDVETFELVNA